MERLDIKRLVIGMALAMALMFGWQYVVMKQYEKHPEWKKPGDAGPVVKVTDAPGTRPAAMMRPTTTGPAGEMPQSAPATQGASTIEVKSAPVAAVAMLGSAKTKDPDYSLQISASGRGAGIDGVILNQFFATVKKVEPYRFETPFEGAEDVSRVLATRWVSVNGQEYDLSNKNWVLEKVTAEEATYSVQVGGVRVVKTIAVRAKKAEPAGSMGYEVKVSQTIENAGPQAVTVATAINGPVPPIREIDSVDDRQAIAGYQVEGSVVATGHTFSQFSVEKPALDLTKDKKGQGVTWFGASSVYFDAILRPLPAGAGEGKVMPLKSVTTEALNPDEKQADKRLVTTGLQTAEVKLEAGERATLPMEVFFGPKKRDLLQNNYYSAVPLGYDSTLSTNLSSCYTYCTFGWLINFLVALLAGFHWVVRDWGVAIILLVVIVRVCLHPIMKRSQISMLKMGKMGPEIEKLKKKYGDDKEGLNKATMSVYKEQGATPILGCLPMILQMPIWMALYASLQNTFELRQEGFLWFGNWGLTWIRDLSKPDRAFYFPNHPVNLYFIHFDAVNLLPIVMGVVYWLQQKFTPKPPANTPEQVQQQKMMQWMSLLFPVFLYNGPAGLNLYIATSAAVGIVESRRIRAHIKQQEEAEREGKVLVETTRKMRRGGGEEREEKKSGGLSGWLADLQEKAEEMRKKKK
ncbi:MAG TPA: membrane protein insertase YidC [Tepidisphaeraceae bacterium]|jgi:YidC/Oxa1 family membrane protein insertase|nr:membrane protein insertase YidC [Tepidisphaeraceae bacterium]